MYRYLDRPVEQLAEPDWFLLAAMRGWVAAVRGGRCPCRALLQGFVTRGVEPVLGDFSIAMAALDQDGYERIAFGTAECAHVGDDEARLLALFAAGRGTDAARVRGMASGLVKDDAVAPLARAVELIAATVA